MNEGSGFRDGRVQMNILYVKRAYNTRLHTQIQALSERNHSLILFLEARPEDGYNGPGQWDAREIHRRYPVIYASSGNARPGRHHASGIAGRFLNRWERTRRAPISAGATPSMERRFLKTLDRIFVKYRVDVVLSGNDALPDGDRGTRLVLDRFGGKIPIVYDCQDILSDCFIGDERVEECERAVHEKADGVIHTNPPALNWAASRYRLKKGVFFPNYSSSKYFLKKEARLSAADGRIHLVYSGGVQRTPEGDRYPYARDLKRRFMEIASLGHPLHLHLGMYPGSALDDYYSKLDKTPNIRLHPYRPFPEMMRDLTRYDVGLFPLDLSSLDSQIAEGGPQVLDQSRFSRIDTSKQYEYILAGLPVLTAPVRWVSDFLKENRFGAPFQTIEELGCILKSGEIAGYAESVGQTAARFSIENKIDELERFLMEAAGK
jgi:hypothetical protein